MCILSVYLLTVVGYYDLSVLSTSAMGFQKKSFNGGGVSSIQVFFGFLDFLNFESPLVYCMNAGLTSPLRKQ